tara:strand:- start:83 stop:2059 length:1977 start_codon:yes stop_codon:yes gene_type:complete
MPLPAFDPLVFRADQVPDAAAEQRKTKKSIQNVLNSYVGWYDPFAELVQNALDSVEKREKVANSKYKKKVRVLVDLENNQFTISDNGMGLDEATFKQFLAPNASFKDFDSRGSKGVGATYVAYGFNYLRVDSKTRNFEASGEMVDAKRWLNGDATATNPLVHPTEDGFIDGEFEDFDQGVSVTLQFDSSTKPRDLSWPGLSNADAWFYALSAKTALGAIKSEVEIDGKVTCIDKDGSATERKFSNARFLSPYTYLKRVKKYEDVLDVMAKRLAKHGAAVSMPNSIRNLAGVHLEWNKDEIRTNLSGLEEETIAAIDQYDVKVIASFLYGTKAWKTINQAIGCRGNANVYGPGIQLATDDMPQGELIQIPLNKYIGRQNQAHVLIHFDGAPIDLGRKGFEKDIVDAGKDIASVLVRDAFSKIRSCLKTDDVKSDDLVQGEKLDRWKEMLVGHEAEHPLVLKSKHFFKPLNEISITAEPSREQDVIALFNQLVAGGVIRGIKVVGTNEMMIYDGAFRLVVGPKFSNHVYDEDRNPLGISSSRCDDLEEKYPEGFVSSGLKILEYKYSLDGLITDLTTGDKRRDDIDLVVCWDIGERYEEMFEVNSFLTEDGIEDRPFHGATHQLIDENRKPAMVAIVLRDLIDYLVDPEMEMANQEDLYG